MSLRRCLPFLMLIPLLIYVFTIASRVMVARSVGPPNAGLSNVVKRAIRPTYQVVIPHRSLWSDVESAVLPRVQACSPVPCDGTEMKAIPNSMCSNGDYCPSCVDGPCTIYGCVTTGNPKKACVLIPNPNRLCPGCSNSQDQPCKVQQCLSNCP
jgi:hypothetical protein